MISRARNLSAINLSQANLSNANLTGVSFVNTYLDGADLSGATLIYINWSNTTCPDETNANNDGGTCVNNLG